MTTATLPALFLPALATARPNAFYQPKGGGWEALSTAALRERVGWQVRGLDALGVGFGRRIALIAGAEAEPFALRLALWTVGAVVVPLPAGLSDTELAVCLAAAEAETLAADPAARLPSGAAPADARELEERARARRPEDPALVRLDLGAGGVTAAGGSPHGATVLEHRHLLSAVDGLGTRIDLPAGSPFLATLPHDNPLRTTLDLLCLARGLPIVDATHAGRCWASDGTLAADLARFRPALVAGDFGFYKGLLDWIYQRVQGGSTLRRRAFHWAVAAGKQHRAAHRAGHRSEGLAGRLATAIFAPYRRRLGGRVQVALVDGCLTPGWVEFLLAVGIPVLETYSPATAAAPLTAARRDDLQPGTAGHPLPGIGLRTTDGSIEACAPGHGWHPTGDAGQLTGDGVLTVLGPIGSALATRRGPVYPAPIERTLEGSHFVERAVVIEDGAGGLTALLSPDLDTLRAWAGRQGVAERATERLLAHERVARLFTSEVISINRVLDPSQQIGAWRLLAEGFSRRDGELAPNREPVRRAIAERRAKAEGQFF